MLQACRNDVVLRHFAASLGALTNAKAITASNSTQNASDDVEKVKELTSYSLSRYDRGLTGLKQELGQIRTDDYQWAKKAMLAALLIYCFECMNGRTDIADAQIRSALTMVQQQFLKETQSYRYFGSTQTTESRIEEDLLSAFVRLDINLGSRGLAEKGRYARNPLGMLPVDLGRTVLKIPEVFENVSDARRTIEYIHFWGLPWLQPKILMFKKEDRDMEVDAGTKRVCEILLGQLHEVKQAFAPVLEEASRLPKSSKEYKAIIVTHNYRVCWTLLVTRIYLRGLKGQVSRFNEMAEEVLKHSKFIMSQPDFHRGFVFENEILSTLFIVSTSPVNKELKDTALEMLASTVPRREAGYDSTFLLQVARDLVASEEDEQ
jgi:hypothetical protein